MVKKAKAAPEPQPQASDEALSVERASRDGRPVSTKDIARALRVSSGTVDRAIHYRPGRSAMTKERVLKMVQTLSYKPNLAARYFESARPSSSIRESSRQNWFRSLMQFALAFAMPLGPSKEH